MELGLIFLSLLILPYVSLCKLMCYIDGLVQDCSNSSALADEHIYIYIYISVAYRYRKSISIIELFVSIYIDIYRVLSN